MLMGQPLAGVALGELNAVYVRVVAVGILTTVNVPLYADSVAPDTAIVAPTPRLCGNLNDAVTVVPELVSVSRLNNGQRFDPVENCIPLPD
jgi:hypothetical protein